MYQVSDEEVDYILNDIKAHGVTIEDLQYNLLDHICCIIENDKPTDKNFYEFYEYILPRFFKDNLKEIEEETNVLLTFKHYYAMKNTLKITGLTSAGLTLLGATLKILHLPGAAVIIVLGALLFSLIFLPLMIILKFKDEGTKTDKWVLSLGMLLGMGASTGILFKLMHWPFANMLMGWSIGFFVFLYVPLYYLTRVRRPELKFNTTVNSVLMMACGGLLFALFNLGYGKQHVDNYEPSYAFTIENKNELITANKAIIAQVTDKDTAKFIHHQSEILLNKIDEIKWNLISKIDKISLEKAKNASYPKHPKSNETKLVSEHFINSKDATNMSALITEVDLYNQTLAKYYPEESERRINLEILDLKNTTEKVIFHELAQIQLKIAMNENAILHGQLAAN